MYLESIKASCPYCAELIEFLYEPLEFGQEYIEDCQICCQPILVKISSQEIDQSSQLTCFRTDETS